MRIRTKSGQRTKYSTAALKRALKLLDSAYEEVAPGQFRTSKASIRFRRLPQGLQKAAFGIAVSRPVERVPLGAEDVSAQAAMTAQLARLETQIEEYIEATEDLQIVLGRRQPKRRATRAWEVIRKHLGSELDIPQALAILRDLQQRGAPGPRQAARTTELLRKAKEFHGQGLSQRRMAPRLFPDLAPDKAYKATRNLFQRYRSELPRLPHS